MSDDWNNEEILASLEQEGEQQPAEAAPQEGVENVEATPEGEQPAPQGFSFKTYDDLLGHSVKYTANGKEVEEPISTVLQRASQGYHYSQRMNELKAQEADWQKRVEEADSVASKYKDIDEYAKQNPEWFDHWNNAFQNRHLPVGNNTPEQQGFDPAQITHMIDQKLQPFQETMQQQQARIEQERIQQEDAELQQQVDATFKEFSDVDFSATDPANGQSLEHKVYQFMMDNRINDFNRAYKLMDYDNIMARRVEQARADLVKQEQMKRKQGIVSETSGAAKQPAQLDLRNLSHDQEQALMLQELEKHRQGG